MLILLSPAKKLDFSNAPTGLPRTAPALWSDTKELMETARGLSSHEIAELMKLSDSLATLNHQRFQDFSTKGPRPRSGKQAMLAFDGDTYAGLAARDFDDEQTAFAQRHLRILSGLYGLLRPLDVIQPYRLEMGTRLATPRGSSLYEFWGERITESINRESKRQGATAIINLASGEYFGVVKPKRLDTRLITPVFKERRAGGLKIISFSAKRARGAMARYAIEKLLTEPEALQDFDRDGYGFDAERSTKTEWLFVRDQPAPAQRGAA